MSHHTSRMIDRFNPSVPRRYLFLFSGFLWTVAGGILCVRAAFWLEDFSFGSEIAFEAAGALLGAMVYLFLFVKIVEKNISRITQLPEKPCMFAFTAWHGYALIALMIALGIEARSVPIPKYILSVSYTTMGIVLIFGSLRFYREFRAVRTLQS